MDSDPRLTDRRDQSEMSRPQFLSWRSAFNNLLGCAASAATDEQCTAGWLHDAGAFIADGDERRIAGMVRYYLGSRLRAAPDERQRWCQA